MPAAAAVPASTGSPYHSFSASSTPPKQKVNRYQGKELRSPPPKRPVLYSCHTNKCRQHTQRPQIRPSNTDTDRHQKCAGRTAQYDTPQMECLIHHQCRQTKKYTIRQGVFQQKTGQRKIRNTQNTPCGATCDKYTPQRV